MSQREALRRAEQSRRDQEEYYRQRRERGGSFTILEWCAYRRISRAMFYKLAAAGDAPRTHRAGNKRLISAEADADWLRDREEAAA